MKDEEGKRLDDSTALSIIEKYWSFAISQSIQDIKMFKDRSGVVFDLRRSEAESFVENFKLLKVRLGRSIDFDVKICSSLPDVEGGGYDPARQSRRREDYSGGGGGNYGSGGGRGGDGRHGGSKGGYGDRDHRRDGQIGGSKSNRGFRNDGHRSGNDWGNSGTSGWNMDKRNIELNDIQFDGLYDRHQNRGQSFDPILSQRSNNHEERKADFS